MNLVKRVVSEMEMAAVDLMTAQHGKIWQIGEIVDFLPSASERSERRPSEGWFIVYTGGCDERRAAAALSLRGWAVYLPIVAKWVPVKKRGGLRAERKKRNKGEASEPMRRIEVPLYPRYLFVEVVPKVSTCWPLMDVPGVSLVLKRDADTFVSLDREAIADIERRVATHDSAPPKRANLLKPKAGTPIRITGGPFADFTAIVTPGGHEAEVKCELELFGRPTPVRVDLDDIDVLE
ncbi:transcription termination/antitermination protein NusG [Kaistia terrae]|uniref:Transcription termination/antitermination protein NusG n=1 Tax=Kaistia terrae TaxID=537017 RepID=A0ABW0Q3K1_9HYPH|nr:transcription termination/antitermination NusG family protein [Kaistia terrae]MCX5581336.1 hypothetical protein [Kaistia terrae]